MEASISRVWELFGELNKIPRPSHHEGLVADYLCHFATRLGLSYKRDRENCIVISKPASRGCEDWPTTVILNHMDMVCVGGANYQPTHDAIVSVTNNGWMSAKGTSLGADNGVGLSIALALLEDTETPHGPLEVLTTTNEEDGMTGAANLAPDFIEGRHVINLDSEDYDTITTGAAGAYMQRHELNWKYGKETNGNEFLTISISGGRGGHSGVDINKGRANAIELMAQLLGQMMQTEVICVGDFTGGESRASIATHASATIAVKNAQLATDLLTQTSKDLLSNYKESDNKLSITWKKAASQPLLGKKESADLIHLLNSIPNGVIAMREDLEGTVKTSNNLGLVKQTDGSIVFTTHTRSFCDKEMERIGKEIANSVEKNGGRSHLEANSPAWEETKDSPFIKNVQDTFEQVLGFRPRTVAMHFVLEAGYLVKKYPGIEIACIGPRIESPHSTTERVEMSTVGNILKVTKSLLSTRI